MPATFFRELLGFRLYTDPAIPKDEIHFKDEVRFGGGTTLVFGERKRLRFEPSLGGCFVEDPKELTECPQCGIFDRAGHRCEGATGK